MLRKELQFRITETGCHEVTSHKAGTTGYPHIHKFGKAKNAHRYIYALVHGPLPRNRMVCHKCDNRLCINIDHLYLGTAKDNSRDAIQRGRSIFDGEKHPKAKLNNDKVKLIRASRQGNQLLADKFGVTVETIWRVRNNKIWKKVA